MTSGLRSGEVAAATGVNLETLRYYERRGLLVEPDRSLGGHRMYPSETVTVLRVIKAAQRLGFTLDEVADLLAAGRHHHRGPDASLAAGARQKLAQVEAKIADLEVIADTLRHGRRRLRRLDHVRGKQLLPDPVRHQHRRATPMSTCRTTNSVRTRRRLPTGLAGLGVVACFACCALPLLLAAGAVSGVGWTITGRWLPAIAVLLIASAGVLWWSARRHRHQGAVPHSPFRPRPVAQARRVGRSNAAP